MSIVCRTDEGKARRGGRSSAFWSRPSARLSPATEEAREWTGLPSMAAEAAGSGKGVPSSASDTMFEREFGERKDSIESQHTYRVQEVALGHDRHRGQATITRRWGACAKRKTAHTQSYTTCDDT